MNVEKAARELASKSFSLVSSDEWTLNRRLPREWGEFAASWDRLAPDRYMKPGDGFRERRFCKYRVEATTMSFEELDDVAFYQPAALNSYAGGQQREFSPIEPEMRKSPILREIIRTCLEAILRFDNSRAGVWKVYAHQFRINCNGASVGRPTPEGLHRDGHDFISMHLMDRVRIEGGRSDICDKNGRALMSVTLANRMDGFLLNDRAVLHGVTPIAPTGADAGHRDMLVIDYNRQE